MRRTSWLIASVGLSAGLLFAGDAARVRPVPESLPVVERSGESVVKETWDWAKAMVPVAGRFTGRDGMIICIGDSLTYANQSTRWARAGRKARGATDSDKAVLKWSHADDGTKETNGWWMAAVDHPGGGRSETAASGIRTDQYIKGGHYGMPPLKDILKRFNPQVAFVLLGTNDSPRRKADDILKDMNTIVEMMLNNGTIPVVTTCPPCRSKSKHDRIKEINARYLSLAAARGIPIVDLYGEMVSRRPNGAWQGTLVGRDGVHLTHKLSNGPPTEENLKNCGYLLRCWLTVQKLKEIKDKVIDGRAAAHPRSERPGEREPGVKIAFPGVPYTWTAPPLKRPKARVVNVSTAAELRTALRSGVRDTLVLLADGVYKLDRPIYLSNARNLSIRGAGGDRDKVVIQGPGMAHAPGRPRFSGFAWAGNSSGLEVANLTIRDFPYHGVHISGRDVHLYNVHFLDMGQQLVKVNAAGDAIPDGGVMEYCLIEYTNRLWGGNYTQGISIVRGKNWVVRHCVFRNIRAAKGQGLGGPAILMWGGSQHMAAVGNVFIDCDCGIAFGLGTNRRAPYHLTDGLIAGNVLVRNKVDRAADYGIAVANGKNIRVVHNTVWNPTVGGLNWSLECRFECDDLLFANNLCRFKFQKRAGKHTNLRLLNNVVSADLSWFRDLKGYDLHLTAKAVGALGKAVELPADPLDPGLDADSDKRPAIGADVGADQRTK